MATRKLGRLEVSEMGAGCMSISANYGPPPKGPRNQGHSRRPREGVTFFDTAEVYGPYTNEELVGEALAPIRDKVGSPPSSASTSKAGGAEQPARAHQEGGRGSLKRLRTDRIDLYYQHRVDPKVPIEDVAGTVKDLIKAGKVLHFGLSEASPQPSAGRTPSNRGRRANRILAHGERPRANGVLQACEELGIGFVPWGPVDGLSDRQDRRAHEARPEDGPSLGVRSLFAGEPGREQADRGPAKRLRAKRRNAGSSRLAWLLAQKPWIVPIPGTRNIDT